MTLPTLPGYVFALNGLLAAQEPDEEMIIHVIQTDASLTAQVLRMANLYLFENQPPIFKVRNAIERLGRSRLRTLILTAPILNCAGDQKRWARVQAVWQNNYMTANLSRVIAESAQYADPELAYVAGLVHNLGEVCSLNEGVLNSDPRSRSDRAQRLAISCQFPYKLVEVCATYPEPELAIHDPALVKIVKLARDFSEACGLTLSGPPRRLMTSAIQAPEGLKQQMQMIAVEGSDLAQRMSDAFLAKRALLEFSLAGLMRAATADGINNESPKEVQKQGFSRLMFSESIAS